MFKCKVFLSESYMNVCRVTVWKLHCLPAPLPLSLPLSTSTHAVLYVLSPILPLFPQSRSPLHTQTPYKTNIAADEQAIFKAWRRLPVCLFTQQLRTGEAVLDSGYQLYSKMYLFLSVHCSVNSYNNWGGTTDYFQIFTHSNCPFWVNRDPQ